MNKLLLTLIMLPSALWKSMGADIGQLEAILHTKLLMDDRKPLSMAMGRNSGQKKERKYSSLTNMLLFSVMGIFYAFPLAIVSDRIFSVTIYFSMVLVMLTMMLITDFSSVLFDSRDKYILFPRPVNDSTLVLARLLHVFVYLVRIIIPMCAAGWIMLGYRDGWKSAALFPVPMILMVFIALFVVNSVYLLVLRLVRPEKFKDAINYFQVVTSVIFFASVYLLPRLFDTDHPHQFNILDYPWLRFVPSYWLASCWSWIGYSAVLPGAGLYSIAAIAVPLLFIYITVKWLSPQFAKRISGIDAVTSGEGAPPGVKQKAPGKLYLKLAYLFNRSDDARAGFMIAWLQTNRSRSFRMRVYPTFAYIPVYFVYLLSSNHRGFSGMFHHLGETPLQLLLLYMSSFVMITALTYMTMSDQYKASWVYYSTPVAIPGKIMLGAFKAIWVKYFMPFFIVLSGFILYVWGVNVLWDILLAFVNVTLFVSCMARVSHRQLPFSMMEQMKQGGARILKSFIIMIVPAALGFGHYFSLNLLWLKLIFLVLSSILLWLVWDSYANTSWANVMKEQEDR